MRDGALLFNAPAGGGGGQAARLMAAVGGTAPGRERDDGRDTGFGRGGSGAVPGRAAARFTAS